MTTEIELDDELVAEAIRVSGIEDLNELIAEALRVLIATKRRLSLLDLKSKSELAPGYDPKELG
jgi:Arc/MetJ family transcription regulator